MRMRPITFPRVFSVVHLVTLAFGMTKRPDAEVSQFISFEGRRRTRHGQRDPELRTGLRTANQIDAAVVRVHDLSHDAEAEPGALDLRREERVINAIAQLRGHAGAVVDDVDDDRRVEFGLDAELRIRLD